MLRAGGRDAPPAPHHPNICPEGPWQAPVSGLASPEFGFPLSPAQRPLSFPPPPPPLVERLFRWVFLVPSTLPLYSPSTLPLYSPSTLPLYSPSTLPALFSLLLALILFGAGRYEQRRCCYRR
jgi:hypothetical protein